MGTATRESGRKARLTARACTDGLMEISMTVTGCSDLSTVKEQTILPMAIVTQDSISMASRGE